MHIYVNDRCAYLPEENRRLSHEKLAHQRPSSGGDLVVHLDTSWTYSRIIDEDLGANGVEDYLRYNLDSYFPFEPGEVLFAQRLLNSSDSTSTRRLVGVVERTKFETFRNKVRLDSADVSYLPFVYSLVKANRNLRNDPYALLHLEEGRVHLLTYDPEPSKTISLATDREEPLHRLLGQELDESTPIYRSPSFTANSDFQESVFAGREIQASPSESIELISDSFFDEGEDTSGQESSTGALLSSSLAVFFLLAVGLVLFQWNLSREYDSLRNELDSIHSEYEKKVALMDASRSNQGPKTPEVTELLSSLNGVTPEDLFVEKLVVTLEGGDYSDSKKNHRVTIEGSSEELTDFRRLFTAIRNRIRNVSADVERSSARFRFTLEGNLK